VKLIRDHTQTCNRFEYYKLYSCPPDQWIKENWLIEWLIDWLIYWLKRHSFNVSFVFIKLNTSSMLSLCHAFSVVTPSIGNSKFLNRFDGYQGGLYSTSHSKVTFWLTKLTKCTQAPWLDWVHLRVGVLRENYVKFQNEWMNEWMS